MEIQNNRFILNIYFSNTENISKTRFWTVNFANLLWTFLLSFFFNIPCVFWKGHENKLALNRKIAHKLTVSHRQIVNSFTYNFVWIVENWSSWKLCFKLSIQQIWSLFNTDMVWISCELRLHSFWNNSAQIVLNKTITFVLYLIIFFFFFQFSWQNVLCFLLGVVS